MKDGIDHAIGVLQSLELTDVMRKEQKKAAKRQIRFARNFDEKRKKKFSRARHNRHTRPLKQVALLSQKGRAMLSVCQQLLPVSFNSTKRRLESFIVSYVGYRVITACS